MNWERRPEADTPHSAPRTITDDEGRRWSGMVTSGRMGGGEEYADVIFACEDQPAASKRVSRLHEPPARASESWSRMEEREVREIFDRSMPA
jgi:hypothetical protein